MLAPIESAMMVTATPRRAAFSRAAVNWFATSPSFVDVRFKADSPTGAVDGREHRGKNLVAIRQDVIGVAARQVGANERGHVLRIPLVLGRHSTDDAQCLLVLCQHQAQPQDRGDDQRNEETRADGQAHTLPRCNTRACDGQE